MAARVPSAFLWRYPSLQEEHRVEFHWTKQKLHHIIAFCPQTVFHCGHFCGIMHPVLAGLLFLLKSECGLGSVFSARVCMCRSASNRSRVKLGTNSQRMTQEVGKIMWKAMLELLGCRRTQLCTHTHTHTHCLTSRIRKRFWHWNMGKTK